MITQNRDASAHGGLAYYIHNNLAHTIITCENESQYWEEMFSTLTDPVETKHTKFSIGHFYRPPHNQVVKLNSRKHKKEPWMTYGILNYLHHKNKLYKRQKKARNNSPDYDINKLTFNTYRNSLRRIIYLTKKDYFCKQN